MAWGLAEFDAEQRGYKSGIIQGISQGIQQGKHQAKIETAKNMIRKDIPFDTIAECTGLSIQTLKELNTNNNN